MQLISPGSDSDAHGKNGKNSSITHFLPVNVSIVNLLIVIEFFEIFLHVLFE